ncbi:Gfo/Idh/MocA family protein [Celerinatantimonas sp. YJH-8]|uniref:Gfo/Idh/MocA family protein n=1 Tax=Celerinatantimonas sp. YJH-8 TaxID=3228714 RepID=UPI0038C28499
MKVALVGSGKIVLSCIDALNQLEDIEIAALCVRPQSRQKGEQLQHQHHIQKLYTDYAALLADETIDFVYLGIPNNLHFQYAQAALQAGKHVICEKPFTSTYTETSQLAELAKQNQLFLFEAITSIHTPCFKRFQSALAQLGDIKLIQCNYSQYSSRYDAYVQGNVHPVFDPAMSGGALYDINLYNVYLVIALFGEPVDIHYYCNQGFNGIDTSGTLFLQYADFIAVCSGAKDSESPGYVTVQGTQGYARIISPPNVCNSIELNIQGKVETQQDSQDVNHMVYEFEQFKSLYDAGDLKTCYQLLDMALTVSNTLEQARKEVGIVFPGDA